ncbi:MAG: ATP-binding protein, partial [Patescibacteria group bacterium]
EPVLVKTDGQVQLTQIGPLIEQLIAKHGITYHDSELEGVGNPPALHVFAYDKNLRGGWTKVKVAARKSFTKRERLYRIHTKSGRTITVTADHSLVILSQGKIKAVRGQAVKVGDPVPLPRNVAEPHAGLTEIYPKEWISDWQPHLATSLALDKDLLTLWGLTTSEGLINSKTLIIFNQDQEVLCAIFQAASKLGLKPSPRFAYPKKTLCGYYLGPNAYARLFTALGLAGKSGEKRVPPLLFSLSNQQIAVYLRAYFEGDGTICEKEVSCCSKSPELISDFAYLLYRFGIIGRIRTKFKRATNAPDAGDTYYELAISGGHQLTAFSKHIGFLTSGKNLRLTQILGKVDNTNVDTIPTLGPIFKKLHTMLYRGDQVKSPANLSALVRNKFAPSPHQLKQVIQALENRIQQLKSLHKAVVYLDRLPNLETLVLRAAKNKRLNHLLWKELGYSWQLMKQSRVAPGTINVLRAHKTITGETFVLPEIKEVLYETFRETGLSLQRFNRSLYTSIVDEARRPGDTTYSTLFEAVNIVKLRYRSLQTTLRHANRIVKELKTLTQSDLFWDPITRIERIKHKESYVYDLTVDNGVFLGGHGGLFVHNSGGGKSYLVKLEVLRSIMFDTEVIIIDPENEYEEMCRAVEGEYITFSFNSNMKINPFDLSQLTDSGENELGLKILSLHGLFKVIMGKLTPEEDALLDRALVATYRQKGITQDPTTQKGEPPLLEDLYKVLVGMEEATARGLADRIEKFIKGSLTGIINEHSNINIKNKFTVFSIRDLADELRPIAMYILLDFIWTKVRRDLKKRVLIVDEAWYLMKYPDSANFLNSIAKRARKYYLGLTTITQDVEDFLAVDLGKAIVQNSSIQILLKQSAAAIDHVAEVFYLSEGEKHLLLSADIGEGLFFAGPAHVSVRVIASPEEHLLVTTRPDEVVARNTPKTPAEAREKSMPLPQNNTSQVVLSTIAPNK